MKNSEWTSANHGDDRTLFTSSAGLEKAKSMITDYKQGRTAEMTPELWTAKKTIDSTLHPGSYKKIG